LARLSTATPHSMDLPEHLPELLSAAGDTGEILERVLAGHRLSEEEALQLLRCRGGALAALGGVAHLLRERRAGRHVTYVVNRNINYTNICHARCAFCAFSRAPGSSDGYLMSPQHVAELAREAAARGATEVCIQGGLHPEAELDTYVSMLRAVKDAADVHIHAFSPMEVKHAAERSGLGIKETLLTLREAGLGSMPGTAAEILVDEVRAELCPGKLTTSEWVEVITQAHRLGIPTTATMLYGHVERPEHIVEHLRILRDIQDRTGGFTEFVPLSFVHANAPLYRSGRARAGASGVEDFLVYSVSRLYLDNFRNIQVSWVKLGRKLAQLMLCFGANDFGGTLMEERISKSAGAEAEPLTEQEIRALISDAGFEPRRRDTLYNLL